MNTLPINGRIAIVDDQINQAQPLIEELSKRKIPFVYYDGKPKHLPINNDNNDIRILFLDINLIDNSFHTVKQLYPVVYATMDRIINDDNFPYILICWSRNSSEYTEIMEKLKKDFSHKAPIATIPLIKSDFFDLNGEKTTLYDEKIDGLFLEIASEMNKHTAFQNLILWENHIHTATNNALTEGLISIDNNWDQSANWIFTKWGMAFAGKKFNQYSSVEKLQAAYHTLNHFLHENIEEEIEKNINTNINFDEDKTEQALSLSKFNERLLFSFVQTTAKEAGRIVITNETYSEFKDTLCFAISGEDSNLRELLKEVKDQKEKRKQKDAYYRKIRQQIRNNWDIFKLVINPVCDFAQDKVKRSRVIPGIFIEKKYRELINDKTDALYVSPNFYYTKKQNEYFFILDFRYFTSEKEDEGESCVKLKQQVLAEILSKLSRHINRQGILYIDE